MSIGPRIFSYAQGYHGELIEAHGRLNTVDGLEDVYFANGQTMIGPTTRWRDKKLQPHAPKMFTPLAAASLGDTRVDMHSFFLNSADEAHVKDVVLDLCR